MSYRELLTQTFNLPVERMGSTHFGLAPKKYDGTVFDLTGSTVHLWIGAPAPYAPVTLAISQVTPASGFTITSTLVSFDVTEADLNSWGLPPGNWPYELLVSNDGGTTTDKIFKGNIIVASWLTNTY